MNIIAVAKELGSEKGDFMAKSVYLLYNKPIKKVIKF